MIKAEDIIKKVDESKEEALQCLVDALQSPSPTGREKPMGDTMLKWIDKIGLKADVYEYQEDRPNIIAEWFGSKPGKRFLFNGHLDVFPPSEDEGDMGLYGPWSGKIVDDCVYGRGANDMKSGDCAALLAVKFLKEMGFDPKGSIVLNYVSDEENGGEYGVISLLNDKLLHADVGISMEPSDNQLKLGHSGVYTVQLKIFGDGGPSAFPMNLSGAENKYGGQDAIKKATMALQELFKLREEINSRDETIVGRPSLAITRINAGTATNTYARLATITMDRRYVPGETPETADKEIIAVMERIKKKDPTFKYEYIPFFEPAMPIYNISDDSFMVQTLDAAHEELFGEKPEHFRHPGGTDASSIVDKEGVDMPWVGPGFGDKEIATPNEHVPIKNYLDAIKWYMLTLVKVMS